MEDTKFHAIRDDLEEQRRTVERQLAEHGAPVGDDRIDVSVNEGFADSAQATAERSEIFSQIEQLRSHHEELMGALTRIEEGTYGKCERCGQQIPIERLEALPTARLCMSCKRALDE
jgi:DnaK suppressor protein